MWKSRTSLAFDACVPEKVTVMTSPGAVVKLPSV
jgi:hypothetical protein